VKELEQFPFLKDYLETNKHKLIEGPDRQKLLKEGKIRWFDYSVYRNREFFENVKVKIVCPYRAKENTFAIDEEGSFGTTDIYGILPKKESALDIKYLLAVLNSKLLTFWYAKAGKTKGVMLEYFTTPLKRIPIKKLPQDKQEPLVKLVERIVVLKKARYKLFEFWTKWATSLKNDERSLYDVLSKDKEFIREGKFNMTWTLKATFYPDEHLGKTDKLFQDFHVVGGVVKPIIRIYGIDKNNREELSFEVEFNNRELMLHIYLSLLQALESKAEIKTLSQLFDKTVIPIIKGVNRGLNELTPNIIKKVDDDFGRWLKEEKIEGVEPDIVKIDNEVENIEAEIDALVFKLYDLNEDEIKIVFDSLKTPTSYQSKVLEFYRKL